jgi:hypothetical protein
VTLFRDSKGKYQPKPFTLRLKQAKDGALLATFTVDAAQFAAVSAGQVGRSGGSGRVRLFGPRLGGLLLLYFLYTSTC